MYIFLLRGGAFGIWDDVFGIWDGVLGIGDGVFGTVMIQDDTAISLKLIFRRLNLTFLQGLQKFSSKELANWVRSRTSVHTSHCN